MITKLINANVTNAQGWDYQWIVVSAASCTGFWVDQVLGVGVVSSPSEVLQLEIIYPDDCVTLTVKLILIEEGSVCELLLFDICNDDVYEDVHWECNGDGEEYSCEQKVGLAYLNSHYETFNECITCTNCPCGIDSPCQYLSFLGNYACPLIPGGQGTLTITLNTLNPLDIPIVLNNISINGDIIHTCISNCEMQFPNQTYTIPLTLPAGDYYAVLNISAEDDICPINIVSVLVSGCVFTGDPGGPDNPTVSGDLYCCQEIDEFGAGVIGNVGGLNAYILYYGNIDENEDIVIDFGANTVADKLEVYKGVINYLDVANESVPPGLLVASTPYLGATGMCRNISPCFEPAVGLDGDVANDVVQGIKEYSGIYSGQTGITYADRSLILNPGVATELMGTGATHTIAGAYPDYVGSSSNAGQGGPNSGFGRLRVPGGTYTNTDKKLTIVVHNNASDNYSPDCDPVGSGEGFCSGNATAWKLFVHCPTCPTCIQNIDIDVQCNYSEGNINVNLTSGDYASPVTVKLTPNNMSVLDSFYLTPLYLYYNNTTPYIFTQSSSYLTAIITEPVVSGTVLTIFTDINGNLLNLTNSSWTITLIDDNGCTITDYALIECDCLISYNASGAIELCKDEDLALDITLVSSSCIASLGTIVDIELTPSGAPIAITAHPDDDDKLIIFNTETLVSGEYNITFSFLCPDGCFLENVTAEVTVRDWSCNPASVLVDTTCGNTTGSIRLTLCSGQTILGWEGVTGTSSVLTNLGAGLYTVEIEDRYGCLKSYDYFISDSSAVSLNVDPLNIDCSSSVVSSMFFYISGGIPDYTLNLYRLSGSYTLVYTNADYDDLEVILSASVTGGLIVGTYRAIAIDVSGCTTTIEFNITQDYSLTPSIFPQASTCELDNGSITVFTSALDTNIYELYYVSGSTSCTGATTAGQQQYYVTAENYVISGLLAGTHTVCLYNTSNDCCKCASATITNVGVPPSPPTISNPTICQGSSVNLLAYCVTNPSGICTICNSGSHVEIYKPDGSLQYDANPAFGTPIVSPSITTTYTVKCVGNCISESTSVTVYVTTIAPVIGETLEVCETATTYPVFTSSCVGGATSSWNYFGNIHTGSTFNTSLLIPYFLPITLPNLSQIIPVTLTCTTGSCTTTATYTLVRWKAPEIVTQPLTFCVNTSITEAQLQGAVLPLSPTYAGYVIDDINFYSDSNCNAQQTFPFTLTTAVTKYVKVKVLIPDSETGCEPCKCVTQCLPIVITPAPISNLPITYTVACNNITDTYNLVFTNTGVGNLSPTGHIWTFTGSLPGGPQYTFNKNNVVPGTYTVSVTYTGATCLAQGSIQITLPAHPTIVSQPNVEYCKDASGISPINLSINNASSYNIIATPSNGAFISGTSILANTSNIGTTVINTTAYNSQGCSVTGSFSINIVNCDPCLDCTWSLTNLTTTDSSLSVTGAGIYLGLQIAGQYPTNYVIAVRNAGELCNVAPLYYICSGTCSVNYSGVPIINASTLNWNIPLPAATYSLSLESASGGINPAAYASCIEDCCGHPITVSCADCTLTKSFSAILTEEESAVYKMCIPCNNNCFKIKFDAGGSAPDKLEVFTSSTLSPASLIYEDTWDTNIIDWKVIKLNNASTLYNVSAQCSGIPSMTALWIKITSYQGSGTPEITTWNINTECCNCITTCPPMAYPCVSAITEYVDPTGVYYATMKELPSSISNLCNGCLSSCWNLNLANIDGNSSTDICGWINSFIVDDLYNCNTISQKRIQPLFNRCDIGPIGSNDDYFKINGMTTFWDVVNYTYTMTFDFAAEATIMYNWLIRGVNPTGEGIISYPTVSQAFMEYFPTLTECGDDPVKDSISIPLGCYTTSADTAYATITQFSANIIKIDYAINPSTISYTLCSGCTYNRDYNFPNISSNDFLQIHPAADINYSKEATVVRADFHYGLFSQECPLGARYRFSMTDNTYTDPDKWILTTSNNNTIYCVSGVGALTLTGNQIIQYGSSYATSGDVVADILSGNILTMSGLTTTLHPYAVSGENNCFTGS